MTRMDMSLTYEKIAVLESVNRGPCLSLYQETHRSSPDNKQDPIRFRNLVKLLKTSLQEKYPDENLQDFIGPFDALYDDTEFWAHTLEGLAVLGGADQFQVFRLQRPVPEFAVAESSFSLRPLRRYLQSVDRFQILGLSLHKIRLFEGNRNTLDEIIPDSGVPLTISAALGEDSTEGEKSVSSHFGIGHGTIPARHGYSDKQNDMDIDTEKYFRAVDKAVLEHHSRPSGLPLILACLPEHQHLFHQISTNPFLLEKGLGINPDAVPLDELKGHAWQLFEPQYLKRLTTLTGEFTAAKSRGLGSDDAIQVSKAAAAGKVATLLLESDRPDDAENRELLENLAELVGKMGGLVRIIPSERMPGHTGLAASYRY